MDCDHTHKELDDSSDGQESHNEDVPISENDQPSEHTPLLSQNGHDLKPKIRQRAQSWTADRTQLTSKARLTTLQRPSLQSRLTRQVTTIISSAKARCDQGGPCYGYTNPCGKECFKFVSRSPTRALARRSTDEQLQKPSLRSPSYSSLYLTSGQLEGLDEESGGELRKSREDQRHFDSLHGHCSRRSSSINSTKDINSLGNGDSECSPSKARSLSRDVGNRSHHHHVPSNAFLSIGLQTSIAIALHKLPEGFITYATNHANPTLGFAVFVALFIHNITEGFTLALPLFLAFHSRLKAILLSFFLGGLSQPLGAAVAVLWFKAASSRDMERVYGCMFAVTSGIMTSVALSLFSESLQLTHNRNLCLAFAFVGMGILGFSFALTA